ncbi:hypothetical protein ACMFMG_003628 [Clarireedia jacksonii]
MDPSESLLPMAQPTIPPFILSTRCKVDWTKRKMSFMCIECILLPRYSSCGKSWRSYPEKWLAAAHVGSVQQYPYIDVLVSTQNGVHYQIRDLQSREG